MTLINLTPHPVVFEGGTTLPKCERPPRLAEKQERIGMINVIDGVPIYHKTFDLESCDLPDPVPGTHLIVPLLIAQAFSDRHDLLVTNEPIRDEQGRIVGCRSLASVLIPTTRPGAGAGRRLGFSSPAPCGAGAK